MLCIDTCTHSVPNFLKCRKCRNAECRKCYFRDPKVKHFLGARPQTPSPQLTRACGTQPHFRRSHTIQGGGQGKWALWQFCPTTEESLKNALPTTVNTPFWKLHSLAIEPRFHDLGDLANFTYMKTRLYSQMT
jgi:hypothetical protein